MHAEVNNVDILQIADQIAMWQTVCVQMAWLEIRMLPV